VFVTGTTLRIEVVRGGPRLDAWLCDGVFGRVHSRYQRRLSDFAVAGRAVLLHVTARRFFCGTSGCPRRTFAETF
jgi:hypothetical protein